MTTTAMNSPVSCTFATLIKRVRMARGLTQEQFGELVGVSETTVNLWENGKREPMATRVPTLAKKLRLDPMEISRSITTPATP